MFKPQQVYGIASVLKGLVGDYFPSEDCVPKEEFVTNVLTRMNLTHLMKREIQNLSGGELQRFAIAHACTRYLSAPP